MRNNHITKLLTLVCCTAVAVWIGHAIHVQAATDASYADKHFVRSALEGGMAEVQMGQLAAQKGNSDDVKQFGQKMVDDHTRLGDQMKGVANQIGVKPPTSPTVMEQVEYKHLNSLSGDAFDQAYIKDMVKNHEADLKAFKNEASAGASGAVKDIANSGAQMVQQHLDIIKGIAKTHNIPVQ